MSTCSASLSRCDCGEPEGHVLDGQPIHKCDDQVICKGAWTDDERGVVPVIFPGGLTLEEAVAKTREAADAGDPDAIRVLARLVEDGVA